MSLVCEVIDVQAKMDIETLNKKIPEVVQSAATQKNIILTYMEKVYIKFLEKPKINDTLVKRSHDLQNEIATLQDTVASIITNSVTPALEQAESYTKTLQQVNSSIDLVVQLWNYHQQQFKIEEFLRADAYLACAEAIAESSQYLESVCSSGAIGDNLRDELAALYANKQGTLDYKLNTTFNTHVRMTKAASHSQLQVKSGNSDLKGILKALYFCSTQIASLDAVTRFLWDQVFVPIVDFSTEVDVQLADDYASLKITIIDKTTKNKFNSVFEKIKTVLGFLLTYFQVEIEDNLTTLAYIGRDISVNLSELIIKNCLEPTIPVDEEGLAEYNIVISSAADLENELKKSQLFLPETASILEYATSVDVLFINKKITMYMKKAETYMRKDLHDLVEIEDAESNFGSHRKYSVSQSCIDLIYFLELILKEVVAATSEAKTAPLLHTVENICSNYRVKVHKYHQKMLESIPQQMALFYNNCIYMANRLSKWAINTNERIHMPMFGELANTNRSYAMDMMNAFLANQTKQIKETLDRAGLQVATLERVDDDAMKCVRQCLRQQELLKTVWQKVLMQETYNTSIGLILNSMCEVLLAAVFRFEDISSDAAVQLAEMLKMVQTRGGKLFTDPKNVCLYVKLWYKLDEVIYVLNADLADINDRWTDGKGPLGLYFKPEELKRMIRALFQNTDRRSALLAKIH